MALVASWMKEWRGVLSKGKVSDLPEPVKKAIAREKIFGEILVKLTTLILISLLAIIYAIAPKPVDAGMISPLPFVLGLFWVGAFVGLIFALRGRIAEWAIYLSIIIDMTLLIALFWSFHIQYDQPLVFSLKVPMVLYIFVMIALYALRIESKYVLLAGFVVAVEWCGMVVYAYASSNDADLLTRSFVDYVNSGKLLIGAEIEKIVAIMATSTVLAIALMRSKSLLVRAVTEQDAVRKFSRFFDQDVIGRIQEGGGDLSPGSAAMRDAAIVFIDIRNFTIMARQKQPTEVMELLTEYHACVVPIIHGHNGVVDKFLGDGIMATFGAVAPDKNYAADALNAVDRVMQATTIWNRAREKGGRQPLEVNAAAAAGTVLCGVVGDDSRLEYTVIGDAVNLAAKLEKFNKALKVSALTPQSTYDLALTQGYSRQNRVTAYPDAVIPGTDETADLISLHGNPS